MASSTGSVAGSEKESTALLDYHSITCPECGGRVFVASPEVWPHYHQSKKTGAKCYLGRPIGFKP